ncbi:hypothetical protein SISNIDRAFT_423350 [Sistotremastrum niveocremeum HHB9708]|uniref:ferric-chelate reductase (NADPH) n=2 Tax=Sistotremastraceae TaxID=3402574 RepID=A0A164ZP29_9AGAM|nr:hypothetical protein SISNIDRAFT_423350 [Sistotremastrum niveocremeum HHB9708]KZT43028.1 hypothetical protein SISSUDRAFT_1116707 [Sistotremastrum suecicum HHB10207 ss-3]
MSYAYSPELLEVLATSGAPSAADKALKNHYQRLFVKDLWIIIASVVAALTLVRGVSYILTSARISARRKPSDLDEKAEPPSTNTGRFSPRNIPSAIASAFRIVAFRITVPIGPASCASISELTFICSYIAVLLVFAFVDTRNLTITFWEDRAAHLASSQVSLIVALAGKNNFISWLTGVSHEKLNVLHRAAARACLILLWVHAMTRYHGGLPAKWAVATTNWMQSGVLGLSAFTLAALLSVRPIRNRFFEFFLLSHVILVGLFILGGYIHAREPGFGNYLWPALCVWAFDRLGRLGRIILNSRWWSRKGHATATIELLGQDTTRVTLKSRMHWKAGQHAYLIMPSVSTIPTEAHPFTIASIPEALDGTQGPKEKEIVFLIRGRNGFTGRLREHASLQGVGTVTALIDGPYGCPPNLKQFSTCVLIAGGSGVSYTLPLLLDLVHNDRAGTSQCRRVLFVWAVRDAAHLKWISPLLMSALSSASSSLVIDARIYITGKTAGLPTITSPTDEGTKTPSSISSEDEKKIDSITSFTGVKTEYRRPDIHRLLEDEVTTAAGQVSVDVAGPSALSSLVRTALSSEMARPSAVLKGQPSVVLHVETFGMVKH